MTTTRLLEKRAECRTPIEILLIDSAMSTGRGIAYSTIDTRHRLNVPAEHMSASPDDPLDFVHRQEDTQIRLHPRNEFGRYLEDVLHGAARRNAATPQAQPCH
jgi:uncharacterized NAD(P)/FAD-binding protein YdhS